LGGAKSHLTLGEAVRLVHLARGFLLALALAAYLSKVLRHRLVLRNNLPRRMLPERR